MANMNDKEEQKLIEQLRTMPAWQRMARINELNEAARAQIMDDLRRKYPQASEDELRFRYAEHLHGHEIAVRIFQQLADREIRGK